MADAAGDGVASGHTEEERGTGIAVIPNGESSLEMGKADNRGGVHCRDGSGRGGSGGGAGPIPMLVCLIMIRHYYGFVTCTMGIGPFVESQWLLAKSD